MTTELIIGNKYVPHRKNGSSSALETSSMWSEAKRKGQGYLYYTGIYDDTFHCFSDTMADRATGDFFSPADVTPYYGLKPTIHQMILKEKGIEVGDRVRVTHKVPSLDLGWSNSWIPEYMDPLIGKEGVVDAVNPDGGVAVLGWNFPAQTIELVSKKKTPINVKLNKEYSATVNPNGTVSVGCQTIPFEAVEKVYQAIQSMK